MQGIEIFTIIAFLLLYLLTTLVFLSSYFINPLTF